MSSLAMTFAGAKSQTADEMRKVLRFTSPDETLHKSMGAVQAYFQKRLRALVLLASCAAITLIATTRCNFSSKARSTMPMPPRPMIS